MRLRNTFNKLITNVNLIWGIEGFPNQMDFFNEI